MSKTVFKTKPLTFTEEFRENISHTLRDLISLMKSYYSEGSITRASVDQLQQHVQQLSDVFKEHEDAILILDIEDTSEMISCVGRLLLGLQNEIAYMRSTSQPYFPNDWTGIYIKQMSMLNECITGESTSRYRLVSPPEPVFAKQIETRPGRAPLARTLRREEYLSRKINKMYSDYTGHPNEDLARALEKEDSLDERKHTTDLTLARNHRTFVFK